MSQNHVLKWKHITDLPTDWKAFASPEIANQIQIWQREAGRLQESGAYQEFLIQLRRQWAIETGILERLYSLSDGASRTLIEKGLDAALLGREDTDQAPEHVVAMIRDQHHALDGLYELVTDKRPLTISTIKQLHQILTKNQSHCDAVDTLGTSVRTPLISGDWKKQPNNIQFEDGSTFEFCPPEHVAPEMQQLLSWHETHEAIGVPPEVEAAWLHHRFTLIHPFQDGNGRIARCLATLVMLRHHWFPLVVTRKNRTDYLVALRAADNGDLGSLTAFFVTLQSAAIRGAISLSAEVAHGHEEVQSIVSKARKRISARRPVDDQYRDRLTALADSLHNSAVEYLKRQALELESELKKEDANYAVSCQSANRHDGERAKHHYAQIITCANALRYRANFEVYQAWVLLHINMEPVQKTQILLSFHGIGPEIRGVLGCSAMVYTKYLEWDEAEQTRSWRFQDVRPLSDGPFMFTYADEPSQVLIKFGRWMEVCYKRALAIWSETI